MRIRSRRHLAVAVAGLLSLAALTATQQPVAAAPTGKDTGPDVGKVTWTPCFQEQGTFECGTVAVPLDYDRPRRARISISLVRLPAADPSRRIGSLFLNPGGPGGSGVDLVVFAGSSLFTQEVRDRFDLVGFDPRGIARSTELSCFDSPEEWDPLFTGVAFPITDEEVHQWIKADRYLADACARQGGAVLDHMSTANVARDMDRLRAAVGDDELSYYGVSYGSMLGQTYANMFPDHFRALVIDGVLDPVAWTTGEDDEQDLPFSTRLRSDQGAMDTLGEFFRLCDAGGAACALSGGAGAEERYAALASALREQPVTIVDPSTGESFEYNYSFLIGDTLGALYSSFIWPDLASFLVELETLTGARSTTRADASRLGRELSAVRGTRELTSSSSEQSRSPVYTPRTGLPRYQYGPEGLPAVACSDSDNPHRYRDWVDAGAAADESGYFGRIWTWISSICTVWPGEDDDRWTGPFDTDTDNPVLVVGARWDPATRYEGALVAHDLLPNSALLTVNSWGHTSLFTSACADRAIASYLLTQATPAPGTVCQQDLVPWVDFGVP